jgi:hypothetical protein
VKTAALPPQPLCAALVLLFPVISCRTDCVDWRESVELTGEGDVKIDAKKLFGWFAFAFAFVAPAVAA